jgi:hypothetical protein
VRTAEVSLAGKTFVVSAFPRRDLEKLMAFHGDLQKTLESKPIDLRALFEFRSKLVEFLFASVHRAQPEVTPEEFADLEPDVLLSAIAVAIEISSPPKYSLSRFAGSRPN